MDRIDLFIKGTVMSVSSVVSYMVGGFGLVFTVLLGLMFIDFLTGIMVGAFVEGLKSSKGIKGLIRKIYIVLLIGAVFLIEKAVLQTNGVVTDGISAAFCLTEFVSITENGIKLKVPIPEKVKNLISIVKNKTEDNDGANKNNKKDDN